MVELRYGNSTIRVEIPPKASVCILEPARAPALASVAASLNEALDSPIGCSNLERIIAERRPRSLAVAVPDETRFAPLSEMLPVLLDRLEFGLPMPLAEAVTFFIGGGLHPPADGAAIERIFPEGIARGCRIVAHDARKAAIRDYGVTSRGTPVGVNADFAKADFKMVIGQVDPHQFVGFTGGSNGVVIGCAAPQTIENNHSLMFRPNARVGQLRGNPVREDLDEAGEMVGIDLAINYILDKDRQVVFLAAGKPSRVLEFCAEKCAQVYGVPTEDKFDIVVASCGSYPGEISPYQAQKGFYLAAQVLKPCGHILLLAASPQGVGDDIYFDYVSKLCSPEEVTRDFKSNSFRMGAHKAYISGQTLVNPDVAVFSDVDTGILRNCHLRAADPSTVIEEWVSAFEGTPKVAIIPHADTTYFFHKEQPRSAPGGKIAGTPG